ncbi:putative phospholipid ABC transporter permease protein MlaE [bacterium HR37]|jgi:phospholipid/cholesterol/gamma-HCH transport system permease protein|nr:putative phospholipid ABC transporter permease protein MlaE [bacterium HR37]
MNGLTSFFQTTGEILRLFLESIYWSKSAWRSRDKVFMQMMEIGNNTLPVAALISLFIGGVLALQSGPQLAQFGIEENIGGIVGLSMVKELGPVMASILVTGRVGSAMTAEIGSMSVYDEIDALRTMDINPVRFLVMPRFLASFLTLPFLVIYMDIIGWFGGAVVSAVNPDIHVSFSVYYRNLSELVDFSDVVNGLVKAMVFGIVVSVVCCYVGLKTKGGPREIGTSVTKAVVLSFILILIFDYYITRLLMLVGLD